ncbi:hypothetical protein ACFQ09_11585 [Massilia norwichensis]|jgi:hypothetical protein|uniref:Uncharacterized protein n=1 Tax=Massilia norwichensis TaxID=1442366 RepID=A0ABT2A441_9BURK|nr:hypothetical protein [Massilia norwichensis]MCS0588934.1 hypothetical protein [Massilia norwichensis]
MLIKLTLEEWQVLQEVSAEADAGRYLALSGDQPVLEITDETADEYRNLLQDEFEIRGMDERYEPTVRGQILESLIDKLFTG